MHDSLRAGAARDARARRHLRRRRRGAARRRGDLPLSRSKYVDEVVLVTTDEICAAIQDIFEDNRTIAEPAGALAVAGIKKYVAREGCARPHAGRDQLRRQHQFRPPAPRRRARRHRRAARGAAGGGDSRGARQLPALLRAARPAQRHRVQLPLRRRARGAHLRRPALAEGRREKAGAARARSAEAGYRVLDMSDNEMAKLHVRYMVGGHAHGLAARAAVPLRVPGAPGRAAALPARRSARAGTSACSTTATTAPTTAACWPACRCRRRSARELRAAPARPAVRLHRGDRAIPRTGCSSATERRRVSATAASRSGGARTAG